MSSVTGPREKWWAPPSPGSCTEQRGHLNLLSKLNTVTPAAAHKTFLTAFSTALLPSSGYTQAPASLSLTGRPRTACSTPGKAASTLYNRIITSFEQLVVLCLVHSRMGLVFMATRAPCWVLLSPSVTSHHSFPSAGLLPSVPLLIYA